jgi:hypothetical protein
MVTYCGMATAAKIPETKTTTSNSKSEKPHSKSELLGAFLRDLVWHSMLATSTLPLIRNHRTSPLGIYVIENTGRSLTPA